MTLNEFLKKNSFSVVSLLVGVTGITVAVYIYAVSKTEREPVFLVDPVRTEIVSSKRIQDAPIKVIKQDGNEVVSDLTSVTFFFWNSGKQSIRPENILEPLFITLEDPLGEIIDHRVLKRSREVTGFRLLPDNVSRTRKLQIAFDILEHNDGATCQIIYEGQPEARITLSGTIEGARKVRAFYPLSKEELKKKALIHILTLIAVVVSAVITQVLMACLKGKVNENIRRIAVTALAVIFCAVLLWFLLQGEGIMKQSELPVGPNEILPER